MSALTVLPGLGAAPRHVPGPQVVRPGAARRRGHLEVVGPGYCPPSPAPASAPSVGGAATEPSLRLTRRGRRVLAALALAGATLASVGVGAAAGQLAAPPADQGGTVAVSVAPGDDLWSLAGSVAAPGQDVREVVEQVVAINGLSSHELHVGQQLRLPE